MSNDPKISGITNLINAADSISRSTNHHQQPAPADTTIVDPINDITTDYIDAIRSMTMEQRMCILDENNCSYDGCDIKQMRSMVWSVLSVQVPQLAENDSINKTK